MSVELLQLLLLIIIANGAPILIRELLNNKYDLAVDFGGKLPDDKRIFGPSKTWRGILAAIIATTAAAWVLGYSPVTGLLIATYAILGDLISSFIKRRLAIEPSNMAPLLDQIPESLFPALMMMETFKLSISSVILLVLIFVIIELLLSRTLYRWGIRKRPY
ncbi:MAG: CDP-archaeol synthase [Gammaproteobacteria bacterium]|nr:CDP-archaeol synthase [Gammaproteobacteria bacterium]